MKLLITLFAILMCLYPVSHAQTTGSEEALKKVDALFTDLFCWFGSMYDRQSGGCYRSIASREQSRLYPPHIEHTSKFTKPIDWSGTADLIPKAMADALVSFMKEKQIGDPDHPYYGFFLDPNYPRLDPDRELNLRSASRALGMATGVIELFGEAPEFPLPSVSQNPDAYAHLSSGQAFKKWLDGLSWDRTWSAGGTITTQAKLINSLPAEQRTEVLQAGWEQLDTYRDQETGLWGHLDQGDNAATDYVAMNGSYKICRYYWQMEQPIPLADTLKDYALEYFQTHKPDNVLHVYDTIQMINHLQSSLSAPLTAEETEQLFTKGAEYLALFRREDGGFSRQHSGGWGASSFQPAVKQPISDTDSSGLALKTRNAMYEIILGEGNAPPLPYATDERMYALSGTIGETLLFVDLQDPNPRSERNKLGRGMTFGGAAGSDSHLFFSLRPGDSLVDFYFLGIKGNSGSEKDVTVILSYRIDQGDTSQEAGRITLPGKGQESAVRDIPLTTIKALQNSKTLVAFKIETENKEDKFDLESIEVWGKQTDP